MKMIDFFKNKWVVFLVAIPYFFCMNYYLGIRIDGALYTQQVFHRWFPERFIGDPPFMFGNQDSFTIFSPVYGFLIQHLPIDTAAMLITFFIQFFFAVVVILFFQTIARKFNFEHWLLPLSLIFFTLYISGSEKAYIFFSRLVEPFPVPRTFAVSFAILGLATFFHKKKWITPFLTLIGMLFHPLMAGWVLPIWMIYYFPKTKIMIIIFSALFPLAGFIGVIPFSAYPDGWYYKPLTYGPCIGYVIRFSLYIIFLLYFIRNIKDGVLKRFCHASLIVFSIALYWYLWTGINNFILLYQFQVWRMEWLCIIVVFPMFAILLNDIWRDFKKTRTVTTKDLVPFLFGLSLFTDTHSIDGIIIAFALLFLPKKELNQKYIVGLALYYPILNLVMSGYLYMMVSGMPSPAIFNFSLVNALCNRYSLLTTIICIAWGVYAIKKREWLRMLLFVTYPFLPHFLILPIVAIVWPYLKRKYAIVLLIIACLDGLCCPSIRNTVVPLMNHERLQFLCGIIVMVSCVFGYYFAKSKKDYIGTYFVLSSLLFTIPYAILHWDHRKNEQKIEESNLDQFKWHTAFPKIMERGKIFYYVNGFMCGDSRLQFLTGSYVDTKSTVGEIFKEGHHKEAVGRLNALIYKNRDDSTFTGVYMRGNIMRQFFEDSLAVPSILIDRVDFLCKGGEITHLVSDFKNLPYAKKDSILMNVINKEIYLYECPLTLTEKNSNLDARRD